MPKEKQPSQSIVLEYVGPSPEETGGVVLLPEGWHSFEHEEPDDELRAEKLASGKYRLKEA